MIVVHPNIPHVMVDRLENQPLVHGKDYQQRRERAYRRVETLGLKRRWIARQVDRSVRCVSEVLRGTDTGEPTLARIEALLARIDAGEADLPADAIARARGGER